MEMHVSLRRFQGELKNTGQTRQEAIKDETVGNPCPIRSVVTSHQFPGDSRAGVSLTCFAAVSKSQRDVARTECVWCYLGSDADTGLGGSVVVLGQELVEQHVELLLQLRAVRPEAPQL